MSFYEMQNSPLETWDESGFRATMAFIGPWAERNLEAQHFLVNGGLSYPGNFCPLARAKSASIRPFDAASHAESLPNGYDPGTIGYECAVVTIEFRSRGPETSQLYTESLEPNAEFLTLDPTNFYWDATQTTVLKESEAPGMLIRGLDYVLTQYQRQAIPAACLSLPSKVNDRAIPAALLGLTFATETLLYCPPSLQRQITADNVGRWTITHRFSYRPNGWNKFWRPAGASGPGWYQIYDSTGTVYKNYPVADFTPLFA